MMLIRGRQISLIVSVLWCVRGNGGLVRWLVHSLGHEMQPTYTHISEPGWRTGWSSLELIFDWNYYTVGLIYYFKRTWIFDLYGLHKCDCPAYQECIKIINMMRAASWYLAFKRLNSSEIQSRGYSHVFCSRSNGHIWTLLFAFPG